MSDSLPPPFSHLEHDLRLGLDCGQITNVSDWMDRQGIDEPRVRSRLLTLEFEHAWRHGRSIPVELFLSRHPFLRESREALLALVCCEIRWMKGVPEPNSYRLRFPELGPDLEKLFELYELLGGLSFAHWSDLTMSYCLDRGRRAWEASDSVQMPSPAACLALQETFTIERKLGAGQWKDVYEARQESTLQRVAIKLPRRVSEMDYIAEQMLREGRTQALLSHQGIPPVFAMRIGSDQPPMLVEKLIHGVRWSDRILELTLEDNLRILLQVCHAAAYAHRHHQVIHRDIKPDNVMVNDEFGEVYLVDWGLALYVGAEPVADHPAAHASAASGISGTPSYMAPEMALGEPWNCTPRTDVFLLGGVLYQLLCGQSPYSGDNVRMVLLAAARGDIAPPEVRAPDRPIPTALRLIAMKALAYDRADRYADAGEFANAIESYLRHVDAERRCRSAVERLVHLSAANQPAPASPTTTISHAKSNDNASMITRTIAGADPAWQSEILAWSDLANEFRQIRQESVDHGRTRELDVLTYPQEARQQESVCREKLIELALSNGDLNLAALQMNLLREIQVQSLTHFETRLARARRQRRWQQRAKWFVGGLAACVAVLTAFGLDQSRRRERAESLKRSAESMSLRNQALRAASDERAARAEADRLRAEQDALRQQALPHLARAATTSRQHFPQAAAAHLAAALVADDVPDTRVMLFDQLQSALTPHRTSSRRLVAGALAIGSSGRFLATADRHLGKVHCWSLETGERLGIIDAREEHWVERPDRRGAWLPVTTDCVAIPDSDSQFLSVGTDGTLVWFDARSLKIMGREPADRSAVRPLTCVALSKHSDQESTLSLAAGDALDGSVSWWHWSRLNPTDVPRLVRRLSTKGPLVLSVDLTSDGQSLACGGPGGIVQIWRDDDTQPIEMRIAASPPGDRPPDVTVVRFGADDKLLVAGTDDGRLFHWDLSTTPAELPRQLAIPTTGATGPHVVRGLELLRDDSLLVSTSDGRVQRLEARDPDAGRLLWQHQQTVQGLRQVVDLTMSYDEQWFASSGLDGNVVVWNATQSRKFAELTGPADDGGASQVVVTAGDVSAETHRLVLAGMTHDAFLRVLDTDSQVEVRSFVDEPRTRIDKTLAATAVAISPDGGRVASGERNGDLILWDVATGEKLRVAPAHEPIEFSRQPFESPRAFASLRWRRDGKQILSLGFDGQCKLWDAENLQVQEAWEALTTMTNPEVAPLEWQALYTPKTAEILVVSAERMTVWDRAAQTEAHDFQSPISGVEWTCATFSNDGRYLLAGQAAGQIDLWDWNKRQLLRTYAIDPLADEFSPFRFPLDVATEIDGNERTGRERRRTMVQSVALSHDSELVAATFGDGTLRLFHRNTRRLLRVAAGHEFGLSMLSRHTAWFAPDLSLFTWGTDGTTRQWSLHPWHDGLTTLQLSKNARRLAIAPDGTEFTVVFADGTCQRWDADGKRQLTLDVTCGLRFTAVAYSPRREQNQLFLVSESDKVIPFDRARGEQLEGARSESWKVESPPIQAMAFSPDGRKLALAGRKGSIELWDIGGKIRMWQSHGPRQFPGCAGLCFSPDGHRLAVSGLSAGIAILDARTGQRLQTVVGHRERLDFVQQVNHLAWQRTSAGDLLASCGGDGHVRLWRDYGGELRAYFVLSTVALESFAALPDAVNADADFVPIQASDHPVPELDLVAVEFSSDGDRLYVMGSTGRLRIYELSHIHRQHQLSPVMLQDHSRRITSLELRLGRLTPQLRNRLILDMP